ncbi:MAG: [acyl-carrier-protein] S-malonyltransferase [Dehalococcoidia bacterium]|nr:[acyl-carrier-protein] S-malonyltransferase [Dehalococcoidia bacterium]
MGATAFLFPGQGAQFVGMGHDLCEQSAAARGVFRDADDILGYPISSLCFNGPDNDLKRTLYTQPAVFVVSYACLAAAVEAGAVGRKPSPQLVAGHSLGEYTALVAAGAVSFEDGLKLVQTRAQLMEQAGTQHPGTMAAVLGMDMDALQGICTEAGVEMANINAPDQVVISGEVGAIASAMELAKSRGARRVIPLEVGGAFHSRLMAPASSGMAGALDSVSFADPSPAVVANSTAEPLTQGREIGPELIRQLCSPVRWVETIALMKARGIQEYIEFGPGKVLTGLVKRLDKDAVTRNYGDAAAIWGAPA